MPTKEQMNTVREQIEDVISRRYIEGDGDLCSCWFQPETAGPIGMTLVNGTIEGTPEPFNEIPEKAKVELLDQFINWDGFSDEQEWSVIQRVLDREDPDFWMDGVVIETEQQPDLEIEW